PALRLWLPRPATSFGVLWRPSSPVPEPSKKTGSKRSRIRKRSEQFSDLNPSPIDSSSASYYRAQCGICDGEEASLQLAQNADRRPSHARVSLPILTKL